MELYCLSPVVWPHRRHLLCFVSGFSPVLLDAPHLLGITVIVRQRFVDSSEIDIEPLGDPDRGVTTFLDPLSSIPDGDSTPGEVGSLVGLGLRRGHDSVLLDCRIASSAVGGPSDSTHGVIYTVVYQTDQIVGAVCSQALADLLRYRRDSEGPFLVPVE